MGQLLEMPPENDERTGRGAPGPSGLGQPVVRENERHKVVELARTGATEEDIAAELQIPLKRLQKRYRREIEKSRAIAKNEMLAHLYETAKSKSNTTATMFWVKAQCGWRDTGAAENVQFEPSVKITKRTPLIL